MHNCYNSIDYYDGLAAPNSLNSFLFDYSLKILSKN